MDNSKITPQMQSLCMINELAKEVSSFESAFKENHGLSLNEGMLLCSLSKGLHSANSLAAVLKLSSSNTSKIINLVEGKGLINRKICKDDKRQMLFSLSQKGKEKIEAIKCSEIVFPPIIESLISNQIKK